MGNMTEYIGTTEAARLLQMTSRRVVGLCGEGKLPGASRSGRNWRIPVESVKQYMKDAGIPLLEEAADDVREDLAVRLLVSCIPYDGGKSGISTYVREVVKSLAVQGHELTLLREPEEKERGRDCGVSDAGGERGASSLASLVPASSNQISIRSVFAPRWTRRAVFSMLWHLFVLPFWLRRHRRDFDGFVICAANRRVCAWYPIETTATVHDLANFHIPGKYSRLRMFYLAHVLPFFAKRAQHLVAVSEATKSDMVKYWHCREEDVTVLYNGLTCEVGVKSWSWRKDVEEVGESSSSSRKDVKFQSPTQNSNSNSRTILYISRIEHPGKNHVRLIEAYGKLPREMAEAHPLVIAGADWKDAEAVHEAPRRICRASGARQASTSSRVSSKASAFRSSRRWTAAFRARARTTARWAR